MASTKSAKSKITPRDFFLHLLVFAALYASVISFLALIFGYVNLTFPDYSSFYSFRFYSDSYGEIIGPSSVLIIVFPLFILLSWLLGKDLGQNPEKRELKFRKWLIYFTLFAAAVTIMVDLISLVSNFYKGELTSRFLWKVVAVLATAAAVFGYYFWDLKRTAVSKTIKPKLVAWISSIAVGLVIGGGVWLIGTPAEQRARRFDEQRISDLQMIQSQLLNYWIQKEELPEDASELTKDQLAGFILPKDPETGKDYEYHKLTVFSFQLCAVFKTENRTLSSQVYPRQYPLLSTSITIPLKLRPDPFNLWFHYEGRHCFERTIDPELYKKPIR